MIAAVIAALLIVAAFYVVWPLRRKTILKPDFARNDTIEYSNNSLDIEEALSQLELDRSLSKINDEEYQTRRLDLEAQCGSAGENVVVEMSESEMTDVEADIEAEVLIARAKSRRQLEKEDADNNLGNETVNDENIDNDRAVWTCGCDRVMSVHDRFCASCGAARAAPTANV